MTASGFARSMQWIKDVFLKQFRRPPYPRQARALARRFKGKAAENYFQFMTDTFVELSNNRSEREIRHTVIDRRITQGTRSERGMC